MTTDKPSRNEEEYFAQLERERIERKRQELAKLAQDSERKSHYMRCPKCGGHLKTEEYHRIQIDRCPDCHGVWFDAGELDAVLSTQERSGMGKWIGDVMHSLRERRK